MSTLYSRKTTWKALLLVALLFIVAASILYTNYLAGKLQIEEKKKVEMLADVYKRIQSMDDNSDITFMVDILRKNETIPVILIDDKNNITGIRNVSSSDSGRAMTDTTFRNKLLRDFKKHNDPIRIEISPGLNNWIYYKDSILLTELRYFPYIQFALIFIFLLVAYLAFSASRRSEQNRVWVGMAKETAHQLGTPLSSLAGWIEYLSEQLSPAVREQVIPEMEKDLERLSVVTDRFSKIGSEPSLETQNVRALIEENVNYIRKRASGKTAFHIDSPDLTPITAPLSPTLFSWVIENLLKNALDAMNGNGRIDILITQRSGQVMIDISDTGKGISSSNHKAVFRPGYSTKKRGWGLGLSLSKRIIENYHGGKIFVKESTAGKGTTFRIILKK